MTAWMTTLFEFQRSIEEWQSQQQVEDGDEFFHRQIVATPPPPSPNKLTESSGKTSYTTSFNIHVEFSDQPQPSNNNYYCDVFVICVYLW